MATRCNCLEKHFVGRLDFRAGCGDTAMCPTEQKNLPRSTSRLTRQILNPSKPKRELRPAHLCSGLTSCPSPSFPADHRAAFHPLADRVPVHQPGLQLPRPLRQLQQRHLLPQPLQRVGGLGDRAARRGPPVPPARSARHPAQLHLQQLGRAHPQGEQDAAALQCV